MNDAPRAQRRALLEAELKKAEEQIARWQQQATFYRQWLADSGPPSPDAPPNRAARRRAGKGAPVTSS